MTDCEIRAQKISIDDDEFIKQYGEYADLGEVPIMSKKAFLKTVD